MQRNTGSGASQTHTSTSQGGSATTQALRITPTLVLRADSAQERHIQWSEDVVDNENMGKKSSKVCCIYHAPHNAEASSSDDSSSVSSSDSDSGDDGAARSVGGKKTRKGRRGHEHDHNHGKGDCGPGDGSGKGKGTVRKRSPNAYEKQPTMKNKN